MIIDLFEEKVLFVRDSITVKEGPDELVITLMKVTQYKFYWKPIFFVNFQFY